MRKSFSFVGFIFLAGLFISLVLGCSKGSHDFSPVDNAHPLSAAEIGIPLAVLSETTRIVYGRNTDDQFPLSPQTKKTLAPLLASFSYLQVVNNVKRVGLMSVFTDDGAPELHIGFFEGGFIGFGDKMFLIDGSFSEILRLFDAENNE